MEPCIFFVTNLTTWSESEKYITLLKSASRLRVVPINRNCHQSCAQDNHNLFVLGSL